MATSVSKVEVTSLMKLFVHIEILFYSLASLPSLSWHACRDAL